MNRRCRRCKHDLSGEDDVYVHFTGRHGGPYCEECAKTIDADAAYFKSAKAPITKAYRMQLAPVEPVVRTPPEHRRICLHESGHVTAAWLLGHTVFKVSALPDGDDCCLRRIWEE